jgi:carbonic anhydrase
MVRNAGGRVFDQIRTLCALQTMLDCGMTHFHDKNIKEALIGLVPEEEENIEGMKFGEIIE